MNEYSNKLSPTLKMDLLSDAYENVETINLLVRVIEPPTTGMRHQLENLNAFVRTEAGDVLTISLPPEDLDDLAALDFVIYIERSAPLAPEIPSG